MSAEHLYLAQRIDQVCRQRAAHLAIDVDGSQLSSAQLRQRWQSWADTFAAAGMQPGQRVMLITSHRSDFPAILLALWQMECVAVPFEPSVSPDELARAIQEARAHWLISENPAHRAVLAPDAALVEQALQPSWLIGPCQTDAELSPLDTAFFIYTSGTTGTPKCVIYDQRTAAAIIDSLVEAYELTERDVILTPLSPALSATLITGILPGLVQGASLVLPSQPIPGRILKQIAATRTTIFFAVPYFYDLLISAMELRKGLMWESVRLCLSTSAYMPGQIFDSFHALTGLPIRSIYCTSEANQCTFNRATDLALLRDSVGTPQSGVRLRVVDEQGNDVAAGEEGQIIVAGTHLSAGYFHRDDLAQRVYRDGWVYTGDLGVLDEHGYLSMTGRLSDTINVGGHLVNPQEVEQVLRQHPAVQQALVLGQRDDQIGEQVVGWVTLKPGAHTDEHQLIQHCKAALMHYKVPGQIEFVDDLPTSQYGKIRRLAPPKATHAV